ncbi:MAG: hypothetical protein VXZ82_20605 [Planctomycetota bacterium]|nr:hypothetical protein [Planctomycetota bacterium]
MNSDYRNSQEWTASQKTNPFSRIIGAICGAFVVCFISILASVAMQIAGTTATLMWAVALIFGAIVGCAFPRIGQISAYGFVICMNIMLSVTIGRNIGEQIQLFTIFTFVELIFLMAKLAIVSRTDEPWVATKPGSHDSTK